MYSVNLVAPHFMFSVYHLSFLHMCILDQYLGKLSDDVNRTTRLSEKQLEQIEKQAKAEEVRLRQIKLELEAKKELSDEEKTILANLKSEFKVQDEILKKVAKRRKDEKKYKSETKNMKQGKRKINGEEERNGEEK